MVPASKQAFETLANTLIVTSLLAILGCAQPKFIAVDPTTPASADTVNPPPAENPDNSTKPPESRPQPTPSVTPTPAPTPVATPIATPAPTPEPPVNSGMPYKQTIQQDSTANKVDIMIINDNSFSMYPEQMKMAQRFDSFISSISDLDYQIAMTTTDPTVINGMKHGQLLNWQGTSSHLLTPKTPNADSVFRNSIARQETLECSGGPFCASSDERPLWTLQQALNLRDSANAGFFREGVDLVLVVLSDEDENSDGPSWALKPETLLNSFRALYGDSKRLIAHGIVVRPGDKVCLKEQQQTSLTAGAYGTFMAELARLTEGTVGDICAADYASQLKTISQQTRRLLVEFDLDAAPIDGTVKVTLTPNTDIPYKIQGKKLIFSAPPPAGTKIEIEYRK